MVFKHKKEIFFLICLFYISTACFANKKSIDQRVDSIMKLMTLEEKIGQLNQYSSDKVLTGSRTVDKTKQLQIVNGEVGSMLNISGAEETRKAQEFAMKSRLKIPLIFGLDVIHGYRTTFPIPLGEAASWDLSLMEKSARIAATEATAYGLHWTFAPMVDIARDPRWGRVMEGAGEDTYFGSRVAEARVNGFQGKGLGNIDAIMACAKHFAGYGASVGGRDYNSVDMSLRQLNELYLPPFKAAVDAGVATLMNSFNDINGIPATANKYILREKLKGEWGFNGFVVSDWGSIGEMISHGYAKDSIEAAKMAIIGGSDMDMESRCYRKKLKDLVLEGKVPVSFVDEAVKRILIKKYELGLFSDPFRFCSIEKEKQQENNQENRKIAREAGSKSIVLLKNEKQLLPLSKSVGTIALIGPFLKATTENHGCWNVKFADDSERIVSQYEGIKNQLDKSTKILYAKGCNVNDIDKSGFDEAVAIAGNADVVVLSMGEEAYMSGEAKSRSDIRFPGVQEDLIKAIYATGKPVVLMINAGRPLIFDWAADNVQAILYTWWLGTEAGNSIADVLFGKYNPSGKLPMTFPRSVGQIPIYYNHYNTGRPAKNDFQNYLVSGYIDLAHSPKFPFGFGLSYSTFSFSNLKLSSKIMSISNSKSVKISVEVSNTGNYDGEEVAQLYTRNLYGSVIHPVKELKGFEKIFLKKGETKTVSFKLSPNDLKFFDNELHFINEPSDFKVFVGNSSTANLEESFKLVN